MDQRKQFLHYLEHADLDGIEELEGEGVITGVVVLLRVEHPAESGTTLLRTSDVEYFAQLEMLVTASNLLRADDE